MSGIVFSAACSTEMSSKTSFSESARSTTYADRPGQNNQATLQKKNASMLDQLIDRSSLSKTQNEIHGQLWTSTFF